MEWGKIKTVLIGVFAVINIFLLFAYFKGAYTGKTISAELIDDTVVILKNNDIVIDGKIIPVHYENAKICNVENKYANMSDVLEYIWSNENENTKKYLKKSSTDVSEDEFTSICNVDISNYNTKTIQHIKAEIEQTGLLLNTNYKVVDNGDKIYFYAIYENKVFFDSYIRLSIRNDTIYEVYGKNWLGDRVTESSVAEVVSPIEILINFANEKSTDDRLTVTAMRSGYYIGRRGDTVRATASPVWEICVDNQKSYYFDMRNGDLLE